MEKIDIQYDHYKETFKIIRENEKERNKLFIIVIIHILVLFLFMVKPNDIYQTINEISKKYIESGLYFGINVVEIFIWISTLYFSVRYFQINVNIDRKYIYLHDLEKQLSKSLKLEFNRESKAYEDKYPILLNLIYWTYRYIFPITYIIFLIIGLIMSLKNSNILKISISIFVSILLIIMNVLYMMQSYKENK